MNMHIVRSAALLVVGLGAGVVITSAMHSDPAPPAVVHVIEVQAPEVTPAQYLGEDDPIVPLVCGKNLNCSEVEAQQADHAKPKKSADSRTVRTSHSSNGASSTTVTEKTASGSSTTTHSRTSKGVTTTSRSVTVKK